MKTLTAEERETTSVSCPYFRLDFNRWFARSYGISQSTNKMEQQLKARLWLAISRIVEEETLSIEGSQRVTATPRFMAALVELVYNQAISLGEDLESFSRHAGRKTITPDDMFMVTRKNDDLTQLLRDYLGQMNDEQENRNSKR